MKAPTAQSNTEKSAPDESLIVSKDTSSPLLTFIQDTSPESGSVIEVADGVFWLRFALPMKGLNHINLWAIKDRDEWVIVDTGIGNRESKDTWENHFSGLMGNRPVNRIIATHLHPDHTGLAGWICRRFQAPMPHSYDRMQDGDIIKIGGRDWHVVIGSGHSPEHACLWCPELSLVLSGDQILPNISSNVSVWPTEPEANPLGEWISSCYKLRDILPEDTLVCPAHGIPFRGAHARLSKLIEHHEKALKRLYDFCKDPKLSTEIYSVLFRRTINDGNRIMAVGESIAHLNCLKERGMLSRRLNDAGQFTYKSRPPHVVEAIRKASLDAH